MNIRPNPVQSNFDIAFDIAETADVQIKVLAVDGRLIHTKQLGELAEGNHLINIAISEDKWTMGVYLVAIETEESRIIRKIVKTAP